MAKKKRLGHGVQALLNAVAIGMIFEIEPAGRMREFVDLTCLEDTAINGLDSDPVDYGEVTVLAVFDPDSAEDQAIQDFMDNDDVSEREATLLLKFRKTGTGTAPAASTWTYNTITYVGRILEIKPQKIASKEKLAMSIRMKVTAKPTIGVLPTP